MKKNKTGEDKLASAKDYPNLKPFKQDGLTITKADFETRRIQAMAAVAMANRRYQNFWRAVRFGNQYMLAITLSGAAANYQAEKLHEILGSQTHLAVISIVTLFLFLGISNVFAWWHLYKVMQIAQKDEYKVCQWSSSTYTPQMSWLTMQHFVIHILLMTLACVFWLSALTYG